MRQRPYSASHMSTAKQCIPKLSAVSNTRAQDSLTYVVWFRNGRAVNLKNRTAWRKMTCWSFFPDFWGLPAPEGLAISRIFIHRSVQLKTLIQLKKFDVSSPLRSRDVVLQIWYRGQCSKISQNARTFATFPDIVPRKSQLQTAARRTYSMSAMMKGAGVWGKCPIRGCLWTCSVNRCKIRRVHCRVIDSVDAAPRV